MIVKYTRLPPTKCRLSPCGFGEADSKLRADVFAIHVVSELLLLLVAGVSFGKENDLC